MSSMIRNRSFGDGKPKGSITTDFDEIDIILYETWKEIFDGAESDPEQIAEAFIQKYKNIYILHLSSMSQN